MEIGFNFVKHVLVLIDQSQYRKRENFDGTGKN